MTPPKPPLKRLREGAGRLGRRLSAIPATPHDIAKAFAVGVFIGVLPGVGAIVALLAAIVFRMSKVATVLGSFTTNPWTVAFVYAGSYKIGAWVLQHEQPVRWGHILSFQDGWPEELGNAAPSLIVGGVILGLGLAVLSYGVVRLLLHRIRHVGRPKPSGAAG